ncbi:hypothetical protein N7509_012592 [Penicillium cosmopolitanum]|uniref:SH3 domain-containing protein n=1 Tax=Penicillium cosmopolitanum TaxID=1131564 RepID=A0A9W9SJ48_9EURO|nr:uncharacterized protein N7509_012592 [Penicillium cosmopolitanum]KAJ5379473.1 hypothetical protein N7509_012592 [Penicillium cosmopolitanum]
MLQLHLRQPYPNLPTIDRPATNNSLAEPYPDRQFSVIDLRRPLFPVKSASNLSGWHPTATTKDLGFVEGDLIECLNAGDGQWWMGRLRRDRRAVGLFPSNFVELMSEDFVPISRDTSPMVLSGSSPINNPTSAPKKTKTVFRKPFQAHREALSPASNLARSGSNTPVKSSIPQTPPRDGSTPRSVKPLRTHASAVKNQGSVSRPSSVSSRPSSRGVSPIVSPRASVEPERSPSALIARGSISSSRPSSRPVSREVSPMVLQEPEPEPEPEREDSPPAAAPSSASNRTAAWPVALSSAKSLSSASCILPTAPFSTAIYELSTTSFSTTTCALSAAPLPATACTLSCTPISTTTYASTTPTNAFPTTSSVQTSAALSLAHAFEHERSIYANGNTPSPLRDAMEDVMTSLQDMGLPRQAPSPSPRQAPSPSPPPAFNNPWSGDPYNEMNDRTPPATRRRPLTSLGFDGEPVQSVPVHRNSVYSHDHYMDGPPQLNNYVQRMESRLRQLEDQNRSPEDEDGHTVDDDVPPPPPPKHATYHPRNNSIPAQYPHLRGRCSGQDMRSDALNRTFTTKSSATSSSGIQSIGTNVTTSTDKTSQSLMSGASAGGFSATSAGSYARRNGGYDRPNTAMDSFRSRGFSDAGNPERPETPMTGVSYHSSHNTSRQGASSAIPWSSVDHDTGDSGGVFGGLSTPKTKKQGFFKKIFESAKTGAASARSSISVGHGGGTPSPTKGNRAADVVSPLTPHSTRETARDMGPGASPIDWVQVRRDVNRASSPSRNERVERAERCQMMDHPVIYSVEELQDTAEGDENIDGLPVHEPTNFHAANMNLVDKSARFISSLPPMTNSMSLAQGYICRPYKSDVQRLRAIFTWVSEKIAWEEPLDGLEVDIKRVLQAKRGTPEEIALLVHEMCGAVGLHSEIIHGYLKNPGDVLDLESLSRPNHWWNAVLVDEEWRMMDCALANPTNPQRSRFVTTNSSIAESWYFLARPLQFCYTHVPLYPEEQHIVPPVSPDVLLALPAVSEVEAPAFACDADGDFFESGDILRKRALVQPDWFGGQKRITVKAVLPGDEGQGVLKLYAGKKGLMHSSKDIPHPLALAIPIMHTGENPPYDFVLRHPTPHAQRHDLYIMQPQCSRLAVNNTFVFAVRQHSASPSTPPKEDYYAQGRASPSLFNRPSSALSMVSSTAPSTISSNSNEFSASTSAISSSRSASGREKPAKLAIQSPSGKILRLTRKADHMISTENTGNSVTDAVAEGSVWETVIKIGERGTWRGLVLADRVARWCVFCEWECV